MPEYRKWALEAGFDRQMKFIYPEYGNVGAASVPAGIALCQQSGELERGDEVGFWVGSSGMSFVASRFIF